jgi:ABC-type transport system involved in multi-copper enzyme maturation permease subunit
MFRRKKIIAGVIVAVLIPVAAVLLKGLAIGWDITVINREDLFRTALSLFTPLILPLLTIILAADAFMDEHSKGSLRTSVLLPDVRSAHFMAKTGAAFSGAVCMLLALWLSSVISGIALPSRGEWLSSAAFGLLQCIASLLPVLIVLGFAALASQCFKSVGGMIFVLVGLYIVSNILPLWLGGFSRLLPTAWLGFGANIGYLAANSILTAAAGTVFWSAVTLGTALLRFERKMI